MRSINDDAPAQTSAAGVMLWRRIADDIERSIVQGDVVPGERLPGETEIADRFGVNRHTVRRALSELTERGLVRAERGSGTYVETSRLPYPIRPRTRFSEIVGAAGHQAGGRLLASAIEPASRHIAGQLGLAPDAPVVRLEILRSVDRVPVSIGTTWLPVERVPKAARHYRASRSMTKALASAGITDYRRQSTRISASTADALDAARLRLPAGRPLIIIDSVDVTPDRRPVLATHARFAADRVELVVES
jgi:GntR family phosphonate transport system transcriptional regulator